MIYPSIDALLQKIESKYLLVNVASKRAKDMDETGYFQMRENEYKSNILILIIWNWQVR